MKLVIKRRQTIKSKTKIKVKKPAICEDEQLPTLSQTSIHLKSRLSLGLCCINTELRGARPPVFCSRSCIRRTFTVERAQELALHNVKDIRTMIEWNKNHDIRCLRLSSDMFPHFTDSKTEPYTIDFAKKYLKKAGDLAKRYGHRIVMHPGQYNQVGAKSKDVFKKTVQDLAHHAQILDYMGMGYDSVLIVHGGGVYGNKEETKQRWIRQFKKLPNTIRNRLVIENCERQYSVRDCLDISKACKIPVVLDFHHHECYTMLHPNERQEDIIDLFHDVIKSWKGRTPLMHISEQRPGARIGTHSDFIERLTDVLLNYLMYIEPDDHIDLEVEAKLKEQAIMRLYTLYPELLLN